MWANMHTSFTDTFSAPVHVERRWYFPGDFITKWRFVSDIVREYDRPGRLLIGGHSFGGILACAVAARMRRADVVGVITVFSPHLMCWGAGSLMLGAHVPYGIPVVSFGATNDDIVYEAYTEYPQARAHVRVDTDHEGGLLTDPRIARGIAMKSREYLAMQ